MARAPKQPKSATPVEAVGHQAKRLNIPTGQQAHLVEGQETAPPVVLYPRDSSLDPQLVWKGKDQQDAADLAVPAVPIYIQEKLDPRALVENLRDTAAAGEREPELTLFADFDGFAGLDALDLVDFYQHEGNWHNRMILGDSLVVMTSLAEKENLRGQVQTVFIDPPYGIKFGSNWQNSTRKREVGDGKTQDASREPEVIKAFRDTWELGIHSYLAYLRDRLTAARELMATSGSAFVQIGDENLHLVRSLMDEVFGSANFCSVIVYSKTAGTTGALLPGTADFLLWYAKDITQVKYRKLYGNKELGGAGVSLYTHVELPDGTRRPMSAGERAGSQPAPTGSRVFGTDNLTSPRVREARTGYLLDSLPAVPVAGDWPDRGEGHQPLRRRGAPGLRRHLILWPRRRGFAPRCGSRPRSASHPCGSARHVGSAAMSGSIPTYQDLMWPALAALKALGGSATVQEMYEQVVAGEGFTEAQQAVPTPDGRMSQIEYRLHWARTYLKFIGAVENSSRGVWAITDKGRTMPHEQVLADEKAYRAARSAEKRRRAVEPDDLGGGPSDTRAGDHDEVDDLVDEMDWKDALIGHLLALSPGGFERLAQRLLREAGFVNVAVTGRTGDGGLDGMGVYRVSLVSFPVFFQCKRYKGTVGAGAVRDFRGAMVGRGEKGLLITTGSFTRDATAEASRDGAPPVELIDGDRLCDLLREFRLGIAVTERVEFDVSVVESFFDEYI